MNIPTTSNVFLGKGLYQGPAAGYWTVYPQLDQPNNPYSYPLNDVNYPVIGWCVSETETINPEQTYYDVDYYNTLESSLPGWPDDLPKGNGHEPDGYTVWDCINYIINHKVGTPQQVQKAIWYFMDGDDDTPTGNVKTMVDAASDPAVLSAWLATGYPQTGDWVAVLLDFGYKPNGLHYQWIFIEVDP